MSGSRATESGAARPHRVNRWAVLALLCFSLLLIAVDATVLHIALPALTAALEPPAVQPLWIIAISSLIVAPLLVAFRPLGDRYGRRPFVRIALDPERRRRNCTAVNVS